MLAFVSCHSEEDSSCVILWFIEQICISLPLKLAYNLPHKYLKDRMVETDLSSLIERLAGRGLRLVFISNAPTAPGPLGECVQNWNSVFKPNPTDKNPTWRKSQKNAIGNQVSISCLVSWAKSPFGFLKLCSKEQGARSRSFSHPRRPTCGSGVIWAPPFPAAALKPGQRQSWATERWERSPRQHSLMARSWHTQLQACPASTGGKSSPATRGKPVGPWETQQAVLCLPCPCLFIPHPHVRREMWPRKSLLHSLGRHLGWVPHHSHGGFPSLHRRSPQWAIVLWPQQLRLWPGRGCKSGQERLWEAGVVANDLFPARGESRVGFQEEHLISH